MTHNLNFLEQNEPAPPKKIHGHGKRRTLVFIGVSILIIFAIWLVAIVIAAGQLLASALDGRDALQRAQASAIELQFETARSELAEADSSFAQAERSFVLLRTLQFLPWIGPQIKAADTMVVSGRYVIDAIDDVLEIGSELIRLSGLTQEDIANITEGLSPEMSFDDLSSDTKLAILNRLHTSASDLELTQAKIDIALADLEQLDRDELVDPIAEALEPVEEQLHQLQETLRTLTIAANLLPEFAGLEEEKTHLLLFLNNAELRPGGGFIGTFGILKMHGGDIKALDTEDVYTLDRAAEPYIQIDPPEPLRRYNAASEWFFRDGNWSPDFAVSAVQLISLFEQEIRAIPPEDRANIQPPAKIDGVIGFTPDVASDLLEITGPLTAGGQTFNAQNVFDKLEYQVEFGYVGQRIPESQRKEILSQLVDEMKSALFRLPLSEWLEVLDIMERAFQNKQLILYSTDEKTQAILERVGWAGHIEPTTSDVQLVVDANLASLKSDPVVKRHITYEIHRNEDGRYIGRTSITYNHTGTFDWKTTRYRTYTRLYVPTGSELIGVKGSYLNDKTQNPTGAAAPVDVGDDLSEAGLISFGTFTSVEPGDTHTLIFEYTLSKEVVHAIEDGAYDLTFVKQIGAQNHTLTLDLDFDKNVTHAVPPEDSNEWGDDRYRLNTILDQDLEFRIEL